jgi:acyl-CoA synthetase (NDP forming)
LEITNLNKLELIDHFFHPKNITLIGVSRNLMSASGMILSNIRKGEYKGPLYLVNKNIETGGKILDYPVYQRLNEIEGDLDLIFVIVPSRVVPEILEDCATKSVKASGFAESILYNKEKLKLQDELIRIARSNGFVFAGPNCNGIYSDTISLNAIFGPRVRNLSGHISYVTRGGTAGIHAMIETRVRGIGISKFINLGGSADLQIRDFIEYYGQDPETQVIGCYSEGGGGQDFVRTVRRVAEEKPIIFYKAGITEAGKRAALSHVGALAGESSSKIFQGFATQAGLIPAESITELVDICTAFMISYPPKGYNVGILTPAGSLGVMATDAMASEGLNIPRLPSETLEKLNSMLPEYWSHNNPIDLTDSMNFNIFIKIIKILLEENSFDGLLILFADISDNMGKIVDFGMMEGDFFNQFIRDNVKKMRKYIDKAEKPVFFLGPVEAANDLPNFLRSNKIIVLPEFRRIARVFAALVKWNGIRRKNHT